MAEKEDNTVFTTMVADSTADVLHHIGGALALMLMGVGNKKASGFALVLFDPDEKADTHGFMTNVVDQETVVRILTAAATLREQAPPVKL